VALKLDALACARVRKGVEIIEGHVRIQRVRGPVWRHELKLECRPSECVVPGIAIRRSRPWPLEIDHTKRHRVSVLAVDSCTPRFVFAQRRDFEIYLHGSTRAVVSSRDVVEIDVLWLTRVDVAVFYAAVVACWRQSQGVAVWWRVWPPVVRIVCRLCVRILGTAGADAAEVGAAYDRASEVARKPERRERPLQDAALVGVAVEVPVHAVVPGAHHRRRRRRELRGCVCGKRQACDCPQGTHVSSSAPTVSLVSVETRHASWT
jgi:hypothetical protein